MRATHRTAEFFSKGPKTECLSFELQEKQPRSPRLVRKDADQGSWLPPQSLEISIIFQSSATEVIGNMTTSHAIRVAEGEGGSLAPRADSSALFSALFWVAAIGILFLTCWKKKKAMRVFESRSYTPSLCFQKQISDANICVLCFLLEYSTEESRGQLLSVSRHGPGVTPNLTLMLLEILGSQIQASLLCFISVPVTRPCGLPGGFLPHFLM